MSKWSSIKIPIILQKYIATNNISLYFEVDGLIMKTQSSLCSGTRERFRSKGEARQTAGVCYVFDESITNILEKQYNFSSLSLL